MPGDWLNIPLRRCCRVHLSLVLDGIGRPDVLILRHHPISDQARHISDLQKSLMAGPAHLFQVRKYKLLKHQETLPVAVEFNYVVASIHAFSSQMVSFTGHLVYGVTTHKTHHCPHLFAALQLMLKYLKVLLLMV